MRRLRVLSASVVLHFIILSFLLTCVLPPGAWAAPLVTITNPAVDDAGNCVVSGKTMVDVAYRGDRGAPVIKVIIYLDGTPQKEVKLSPPQVSGTLTVPFDFTLATGETHVIAAKAIDSTGGETSATINVRVQKAEVGGAASDKIPPVIRIFYPAHGAQVSGLIKLKADGQDNKGITSVVFYVDGKLHTMLVNAPPWETELNTRRLAEGPHVLSATALDAAGNEGRSAEVTIIVQNQATSLPMPTTFDPAVGGTADPVGPIVVGPAGAGEQPPIIDLPPAPVATLPSAGAPGLAGAATGSSQTAGMLMAAAPMGISGEVPAYRTALPGRAGTTGLITPPRGGLTPAPAAGAAITSPRPGVPEAGAPGLTPARTGLPPVAAAYPPAGPASPGATAGVAAAPTQMGLAEQTLAPPGRASLAPARTATPSGAATVAGIAPAPTRPMAAGPAGITAAAPVTDGAQTSWDPAWGTPRLSIGPARNGQLPESARVAATGHVLPSLPAGVKPQIGVATSSSGPSLQPTAAPAPRITPAGARTAPPDQVALMPHQQPRPVAVETGSVPRVADNVPAAIAHIRNIKLVFNGQPLDLSTLPALQEGISMAPLREIFQSTNGMLYWYPEEKRVEAKNSQVEMKLQIGSAQAEVNGEARELALAPYIKQGRTMVPLQFIADTLNVTITFNPDSGQIVITSNEF